MKAGLAQAAAVAVAASAVSITGVRQLPPRATQLLRTQTAFDLRVRLPYRETARLFGPEGERTWAGKHWDPRFLYPQPEEDEQGAVFTIEHGPVTAIWVNTLFDIEGRHFIYAYFIPGIMVTTVDVRFMNRDPKATQVRVVYTRTALTAEGNEHVQAFTSMDKTAGHDWQQAIDAYLASRPGR